MAKNKESPQERVIALLVGDTGVGKSFFMANLRRALIFDTDIDGGLTYLKDRIARNESEVVRVSSYLEVIEEIRRRQNDISRFLSVGVDHLTTLHQDAVARHNPNMADDFGRSYDKAAREWRKLRELVRCGDFNLFCTAHSKAKYENQKAVGVTSDGAKNLEADFHIVLYPQSSGSYPSITTVKKWRRDPEDTRGPVPRSFPFTMEEFLRLHGADIHGERKVVPMASMDQVREAESLVGIVRIEEGTVDKWFAKAKVESWSEMTSDTIQKCIDFLRERVNPAKKGAA